jgi:hypothetical protein
VAKIVKIVLIGLLAGLALYAFVYFLASHGDAFEFAKQEIRNSHMIESEIGRVERIRLDPFGFYDEKSVGSEEWATMTVEVTGTRKTIALSVKVKKTNGNWAIEQAATQGVPLVLN